MSVLLDAAADGAASRTAADAGPAPLAGQIDGLLTNENVGSAFDKVSSVATTENLQAVTGALGGLFGSKS